MVRISIDSIAHGTGLVTCHVLLYIARRTFTRIYLMRVSKNAWNSHHFGQFFRRGRDAVSMFLESLQRTKVKIHCCTELRVLKWLVGDYVEGFYYFLTNLRASNSYKTACIEGGKVALVKEPFLCTLTANCRRVELLLSISCDV